MLSSKTKASVPILSRCVCLKNLTLLPRSHLHPEVASAPHALNAKPSAQRHVWEKHIAITQNRQPRQAEEIEEQCAQWPCMACSAGHMAKWPPASRWDKVCLYTSIIMEHTTDMGLFALVFRAFIEAGGRNAGRYAAWRGPPVIDIGEWEIAKLTQASTCSSRAVTRESLTTWLPRNPPLRQHRHGKVAGIFNLGGQNKCLGSTRAHLLHLLVRKHRAPAPQERPGAGTRECTPEPSKNLNFEWHGPILNDFLAPLEHSKLEPLAVKRPASCPRTSGKLTCASRFHFLFPGTVDVFKATAQVSSFGFLAFENHSPSNQQPANPLTNGNSLLQPRHRWRCATGRGRCACLIATAVLGRGLHLEQNPGPGSSLSFRSRVWCGTTLGPWPIATAQNLHIPMLLALENGWALHGDELVCSERLAKACRVGDLL